MYDLKELTRYVEVTDKGVKFPHDEPRKIRLEIVAEKETSLYIKDGKDEPFYIGTFHGFEIVQFNVRTACVLLASGAGVKIYTTEFQSDVIELPEAVSFTRSMTRRQRNPELEKIAHTMQMNMERRLAQVTRDVTLRVSQELRERHAEAERERFERASAEEAEAVARSAENAGEDESSQADPDVVTDDVSGSRSKASRQKLSPKPASQR